MYLSSSSDIVVIEEPFRLNVVCPLKIPPSRIVHYHLKSAPPRSPENTKRRKTTVQLVLISTTLNLCVKATCPLLLSTRGYSIVVRHRRQEETVDAEAQTRQKAPPSFTSWTV